MEIFGEVGAKIGPRWAQDGPSWQQVALKMGHDSAKMTMLGSVCELLGVLGAFSVIFSKSFGNLPKCKNDQRSITFASFF